MLRTAPIATVLVALSVQVVLPSGASAAEGESSLTVGAEYAYFSVDTGAAEDADAHGGVLGLALERALDDTFWLRGAAGGGLYDGPSGLAWSGAATLGVTYRFDYVRYVPYLHVGAGALLVGGGGVELTAAPLVEAGLGLEVLESRTFSWGVGASFDYFFRWASYFTVGPHVTWSWGYF